MVNSRAAYGLFHTIIKITHRESFVSRKFCETSFRFMRFSLRHRSHILYSIVKKKKRPKNLKSL